MSITDGDPRRHAPAALRNREPIIAARRGALPPTGMVLEVASGTGEHAAALALAFPLLAWQPSDREPAALASIGGYVAAARLGNLRAPLALDAASPNWPVAGADAVLCINMIHIAPWSACVGLIAGAARILPPGGLLYLYGPFRRDGGHTAESNRLFDADLRHRDPAWGVRDLGDVETLAAAGGLCHEATVEMPANNLSVLFRRMAAA